MKSGRNIGFPKAPPTLSPEARRLWRRLQAEYPLSDEAALLLLETALLSWDRARTARETIDRDGMTIRDKWNQVKAHPLLSTERDARSGMLAAFKALCLDVEPLRDRPGRPGGR